MLSRLLSSLKSKKGFVGALLLFYATVHGIFGLVQDATYAASNWASIVGFLNSGLGNLCVVVAGVLLILWAVLTQHPEPGPTNASPSRADSDQEAERLKVKLRRVEQERDELRAENNELISGAAARTISVNASDSGVADSSLEAPQDVPEAILGGAYLSKLSFRITEMAREHQIIRGRTFEDCTIYGPAILVPLNGTIFMDSSFGAPRADMETVLWEIDPRRTEVFGAIGLDNCTFRGCTFVRIGVAGDHATIETFRTKVGKPPRQAEEP